MTDSQTECQVDMIASAKSAQWTPDFLGMPEVVRAIAPAKVNLFLEIGPRGADGYHDVVNIMHALTLHDVVFVGREVLVDGEAFESDGFYEHELAGPSKNIAVRIEIADRTVGMHEAPLEVPVADNLCFKAIDMLARKCSYAERERIFVRIEKNVPAQAGLGGGSSDAAATLAALARMWGISSSGPTLREAAGAVGADVAFFLEGGCAEYIGRGDMPARKLHPMKKSLVVVKPFKGVSTAQAYVAFDADPLLVPAELAAKAEDVEDAASVPLFNGLERAASSMCPDIAQVGEWLSVQKGVEVIDGKPAVLLCGSGSATFAVTDSFASASKIVSEAQILGWWARATSFSSLRAALC